MDGIRRTGPTWWICLLLATATFATYWPVVHCGFTNHDDDDYITQNPHVLTGLTLGNVRWAFDSTHSNNWHPLTWISHALDCQVFGLKAGGHHLVNLCLHTVNALLLFLLLKRLTGATWRGAFVAALFALHPLHVESVAWVAERKDVLSAFFFILTLGAYARYAQRLGAGSQERKVQSPKSEVRSPTPINREQASKVNVGESGEERPKSEVQSPKSKVRTRAAWWYCAALALYSLRADEQADAGDSALRPAAAGLLATGAF